MEIVISAIRFVDGMMIYVFVKERDMEVVQSELVHVDCAKCCDAFVIGETVEVVYALFGGDGDNPGDS